MAESKQHSKLIPLTNQYQKVNIHTPSLTYNVDVDFPLTEITRLTEIITLANQKQIH